MEFVKKIPKKMSKNDAHIACRKLDPWGGFRVMGGFKVDYTPPFKRKF